MNQGLLVIQKTNRGLTMKFVKQFKELTKARRHRTKGESYTEYSTEYGKTYTEYSTEYSKTYTEYSTEYGKTYAKYSTVMRISNVLLSMT